jgi:transcriptional regulator with XRE-family HTH domain
MSTTTMPEAGPLDLRVRRRRLGLSVDQVAERLQVHPSTVLRYERLDRAPAPATVQALASTLDLPRRDVARFFDPARGGEGAAPAGVRGIGLRALRRRCGISARAVAAWTDVNVSTVYNWENGQARIPQQLVARLAELLELGPAELTAALRAAVVTPPAPTRRRPVHPLVRLRRRAGLSQAAAAEQIGYSRDSLGRWERGVEPPLHALRLLATLYGVHLSRLAAALGIKPPQQLDRRTWASGGLAEVLRVLRSWSGLTQRELAARCGCSVDAVRSWEAGRSVPRPPLRAALEMTFRLDDGALVALVGGRTEECGTAAGR